MNYAELEKEISNLKIEIDEIKNAYIRADELSKAIDNLEYAKQLENQYNKRTSSMRPKF